MLDVVALGELLIDFSHIGTSSKNNDLFEANPGGAPANVLACLAKLGMKTGFIGKVGDDLFGKKLQLALEDASISTEGLIMDKNLNTTLAFIHLDDDGERDFTFYREHSADIYLYPEDINLEMLNTRIFHFGSLSLTDEPARTATKYALSKVNKEHTLVSYDPNLRPRLWKNLKQAKMQILDVMEEADVVKLSDEELEFLTGSKDLAKGCEVLVKKYNLHMIFVTLGAKGCYYKVGTLDGFVPGFSVKTIDTTGAGDAFFGGVLYKILQSRKTLSEWNHEKMIDTSLFANAVGALTTTKRGAISAIPSLEDILSFLSLESTTLDN